MEENASYSLSTAYFAIPSVIITTVILFFLIHKASVEYLPEDPPPELLPIVPETIEQMGYPEFVKAGLYIKDFTEFSFIDNKFEFSGIVWFIIDPSKVSLDTLKNFTFERGKIISKSEPMTRIIGDKLLVRYDVRINFKTNLNFAQFPFDNHILTIILDNNDVSPGELAFQSDYNNITVSSEIRITGWNLTSTKVHTGYSIAQLSRDVEETNVAHPRVVFTLEYVHSGIRQAMLIIFPLMLIFFMALFSFALPPDYYKSIIGLSSGSVTAMLAYRFVIERLSPQVGYFTISDYIFFIFLIAVCTIFFINIGFSRLKEKGSKIVIALLELVIIGTFLLLLGGW